MRGATQSMGKNTLSPDKNYSIPFCCWNKLTLGELSAMLFFHFFYTGLGVEVVLFWSQFDVASEECWYRGTCPMLQCRIGGTRLWRGVKYSIWSVYS
jgi:hypothetical protein